MCQLLSLLKDGGKKRAKELEMESQLGMRVWVWMEQSGERVDQSTSLW